MSDDIHFLHSTLRERIVEHVFVGEVLRSLWKRNITDVEILRPEFDAHGYDVVMSRGRVMRHIQLKTQAKGKISVNTALANMPSGCVVWISIDRKSLELGPYKWFGALPGLPLPLVENYTNPKQTRANSKGIKSARLKHRLIPQSDFEDVASMDEIVQKLFGD